MIRSNVKNKSRLSQGFITLTLALSLFFPATALADNFEEQVTQAKGLFEAQKYDEAIQKSTELLNEQPKNAELLLNRGNSYLSSGKPKEAVEDLKEALANDPEMAVANYNLGLAYNDLGEYEKAKECFTLYLKNEDEPTTYYSRGRSNFFLGQFDAAVSDYSKALSLKPDYLDALYSRACLNMEQLGKHNLALADLNKLVELAPNEGLYHRVRGNAFFETSQLSAAEKEYQKCLELDPKDLDALTSLATTHSEMGKFQEAEEEFLKVLAINPNSEYGNSNLAVIYLLTDRPEKALQGSPDSSNDKEFSTLGVRVWADAAQGNRSALAKDLKKLDRLMALSKPEQQRDCLFANSYAAMAESISGQPERGLQRIDDVLAAAPAENRSLQGWCHGVRSLVLAQLGKKDETEASLARSQAADNTSQTARKLRERAKQVLAGGGTTPSVASATSGGAVPAEGINRPVDDKWALIVGVGKFQDPTIPKLKYATKDAQDFAKFLVEKANFKKDHVRVLLDEQATRVRIYEEIGDKFLPRVASKNDLVLFYFSGHGSGSSHDVKGENYLITHDANKNSLFASGIELQELTKVMKRRIDSDRVLIVLDACHSGGADASSKDIEPGSNFDVNMIAGSGQLVICSSEQDQRSYESQRYSNGIFTKKLMEALAKNGQSTKLKDAFNYLVDEVSREVKEDAAKAQTPVMKSQWNGSDLSVGIVPFKPRAFPPTVKDKLAPDSLSVPANSKPPAAKKPGPPKR